MNSERPDFRVGIIGSAIAIVLMLLLAAYGFAVIPADRPVPIHWNIHGEADGYAGRNVALLVVPALAAFQPLLFLIMARVEPRLRNLRQSMKALNVVWLSAMGLLVVVQTIIVLAGIGLKPNVVLALNICVGVLIVLMGNYLGKVRSNFLMGMRTRWTLSSEYSWNRTHRMAGVLFVLLGLALIAMAFLADPVTWLVLMVGEVLVLSIVTMIYSYAFWRTDPSRSSQPQPGTEVARQHPLLKHSFAVSLLVMVLTAWGLIHVSGLLLDEPTQRNADVAKAVVHALAAGNYHVVMDRFDARMRGSLSEEQLKSAWESLEPRVGRFVQVDSVRSQALWSHEAIHCTSRFEQGRVNVKVVFNRSGEIAGLWLEPAESGG